MVSAFGYRYYTGCAELQILRNPMYILTYTFNRIAKIHGMPASSAELNDLVSHVVSTVRNALTA